MYYLIKYGYDGSMFDGFQCDNSINSIENTIIKTLIEYNISDNIESAARTDKYVSAKGNVFLIKSDDNIIKIMKILNSKIRYMFFYSYSALNDYFNPRHNDAKQYSYILYGKYDIDPIIKTLKKFEGTHDFINFCRVDKRNTVRTIKMIDYNKYPNFYKINFYAKSFIWHQIRSIIEYSLRNAGTDPFSIDKKFPYLADPLPLILMDISYNNISFNNFDYKNSKKYLYSLIKNIKLRSTFYDIFNDNL